jgi:hypothetical protein
MADRRRIAAALEYLGAMRDRAAEFGSGVAGTLANRARDVGGLAYEALTSDPNIGRMNTAEFAQAAASRAPTPRLDAAGQGAVELGRAVLTQPVQTGKALARDQVNAFMGAFDSPRAMGEYAGSMVDPLRLASALRRGPMLELDVYHGTPHRFDPTEENPLGELDASKIGSGEGAQAYGHGIYLAESPDVARTYSADRAYVGASMAGKPLPINYDDPAWLAQKTMDELGDAVKAKAHLEMVQRTASKHQSPETKAAVQGAIDMISAGKVSNKGSLYTLDLPDEMIDRMLDWDKPLSEQSAAVKKALGVVERDFDAENVLIEKAKALGVPVNSLPEYERLEKLMDEAAKFKNETGASFYQGGDPAKRAAELRALGIPGVRYLDAGSRGKDGTGTRNFVVFPGEEKKVKILRRE